MNNKIVLRRVSSFGGRPRGEEEPLSSRRVSSFGGRPRGEERLIAKDQRQYPKISSNNYNQ